MNIKKVAHKHKNRLYFQMLTFREETNAYIREECHDQQGMCSYLRDHLMNHHNSLFHDSLYMFCNKLHIQTLVILQNTLFLSQYNTALP